MASQLATDIERAAAAMRAEAAAVLRRATTASRLGADLSLAMPESPLRTREMATLPEPEGEPLLSLASAASGECCGYIMEDEEGEVGTQKEGGQPSLSVASEAEGVGSASSVKPPDAESSVCTVEADDSEAEAEDVQDEADLAEWVVEREAAEELLQSIMQGVLGDGACGGLPLEAGGAAQDAALAVAAAAPGAEHRAGTSDAAEGAIGAQSEPRPLATTSEVEVPAAAVAAQGGGEAVLQERAASPREAFAVLAPASTYEDLVEAAQQRQAQQRKARVAAFLKENGYVDARAPKRTLLKTKYPIHTAAKQGDAAMVQLLVEHGADPLQKTSWGKTAAQIAKAKDRGGSHSAVLRALGGA